MTNVITKTTKCESASLVSSSFILWWDPASVIEGGVGSKTRKLCVAGVCCTHTSWKLILSYLILFCLISPGKLQAPWRQSVTFHSLIHLSTKEEKKHYIEHLLGARNQLVVRGWSIDNLARLKTWPCILRALYSEEETWIKKQRVTA